MTTAKLDCRRHLRELMAARGMCSTAALRPPAGEHGTNLSGSHVYRRVAEKPDRLILKVLMALLGILRCSIEELLGRTRQSRWPRHSPAALGRHRR
jgi:hypothetical protein